MLVLGMKRFETIDVSGDAGMRAFGSDLKELFVNAALGMYELITDVSGIGELKVVDIAVTSNTIEGLLVSWLNELIFTFDTYGFLGKKIVFEELVAAETEGGGPLRLRASVAGEDFDPEKHERRLLVKAATYHRLKIVKSGDRFQAEVIFDI
jgi:SHS2 domain-containing protein